MITIGLVAAPGKLPKRVRAQLVALDAELFPDDEPQELSGAWWWLARGDDGIAGFCGLRHAGYGDRGYLCLAGVRAAYRRQGLHRRLIRVREQQARRLEWGRVITYALADNVASVNSLVGAGYRLYLPGDTWGGRGALHLFKDLQ